MSAEREAAEVLAVVRAHRRNEVIEPGPILPDETHWPTRTRVKCDSNDCDFYTVERTWHLACAAHEAHLAAALAAAGGGREAGALYSARDALYRGEGPDQYEGSDILYGEWLGNRADALTANGGSDD